MGGENGRNNPLTLGEPRGAFPPGERRDPRDAPLYTLREAARYLGVPEATLRTWVRGRGYPVQGGSKREWSPPLIQTPGGGPFLSFHNLVEANVLAALRREHRISMQRVRQAVEAAKELLQVERPLLLDLQAGLGEVFVEHGRELLSLTRSGQVALREILETFLKRVERDEKGLPLRFRPPVGEKVRSEWITLDPRVAFGAPAVQRVQTRVLALRFNAGEELEEIAEDYGLSLEAVREALVFEGMAA
ncbi:DUF433 domain-containing protein [Thermus sp.]|uniref:DUF433 domain-containing protein n=1 Tax=Thermus sp. TaxID=275 RepID=UPI00321FEB80